MIKFMQNYRPGTFDSRIVQYEKVHAITDQQICAMVAAVDLKPAQTILDSCCGYGSVTRWLIESMGTEKASTCSFFLVDESGVQIERARENLKNHTNTTYHVGDIESLPYENNYFDTVIIKMGLHENPKTTQEKIVQELYRILKPGGKIVIWELYLDIHTQPIFQSFIQKKDELAGFSNLVQKRYFPRDDEIKEVVKKAGFEKFAEHYVFCPVLGTKIRLDELVSKDLKESGLPIAGANLQKVAYTRLEYLNNFLRNCLTDDQKNIIGFVDEGDNIVIHNIKKAIVSATKPL
jgi:ubiquinone/menaquinone biosynthesis C-methylase UbiE